MQFLGRVFDLDPLPAVPHKTGKGPLTPDYAPYSARTGQESSPLPEDAAVSRKQRCRYGSI